MGFYDYHDFEYPKFTANFLELGRDGSELQVTSCEVKNFDVIFLAQFFKIYKKNHSNPLISQIRVQTVIMVIRSILRILVKLEKPGRGIYNRV